MSDENNALPRAGESLDAYIKRTLPGVHAAFNDDALTIEESTCLLFGMQYEAFKRLWEDAASARSRGVAARIIAAACLSDARRALDAGGHDPA